MAVVHIFVFFRKHGTIQNQLLKFQCRHEHDQVVLFPVCLFHDHRQDVEED